jgi:hypothetical protein
MRSAAAMVQLSAELWAELWAERLGPLLTQTKNHNTPVRIGKCTIEIATLCMSILVHDSVHPARLKRGVADFQEVLLQLTPNLQGRPTNGRFIRRTVILRQVEISNIFIPSVSQDIHDFSNIEIF